jgi:EmrB/QacA subfamily drug resistance transporter
MTMDAPHRAPGEAHDDAPSAAFGARRVLIPLVVAFAFFLEQLDATIITTAIPDMAQSLDTTALRLNLALTAYMVTVAVFIPLSGWLADRFGMRRIFAAAIAVFTLGSVLCGLAWSLESLVAARVVQGLGGAMMAPVGRLIMLRSFPRHELARAMTYVALPAILGPTMGPLLGGLITTGVGWRWIFFVNVPFGAAGIAFAWANVREVPGATPGRFDLTGFAMCALVAALAEAGMEALGHHLVSLQLVLALFAASGVMLALYVVHSTGRVAPALDLALLRVRSFRVALLVGGLSRIGINAVPFMLPLLLQLGFGFSPIRSGSITFVSALGALFVRSSSVWLLRRFGFDRLLLGNTCLAALAIGGFALIGPETPVWLMVVYIFGFGVIRNVQFNAIQTLTYADIPRPALSRATSLGGVLQQLAMSFGVSVSATLLGLVGGAGGVIAVADFHMVFLMLAGLTALSLPGLLTLTAQDGALVSNHVRR